MPILVTVLLPSSLITKRPRFRHPISPHSNQRPVSPRRPRIDLLYKVSRLAVVPACPWLHFSIDHARPPGVAAAGDAGSYTAVTKNVLAFCVTGHASFSYFPRRTLLSPKDLHPLAIVTTLTAFGVLSFWLASPSWPSHHKLHRLLLLLSYTTHNYNAQQSGHMQLTHAMA